MCRIIKCHSVVPSNVIPVTSLLPYAGRCLVGYRGVAKKNIKIAFQQSLPRPAASQPSSSSGGEGKPSVTMMKSVAILLLLPRGHPRPDTPHPLYSPPPPPAFSSSSVLGREERHAVIVSLKMK